MRYFRELKINIDPKNFKKINVLNYILNLILEALA